MDSLTQLVLGAAVAAAVAPAKHRRAALLAGGALGTLPDLDVIPIGLLTDDPVERMTWHRGASHSLLVLPWVAWAVWAWCRSRGKRVAEASRRWFWAIMLALVTHPLLDAFTVYGTQLLWPLTPPPAMWSSVFIIDPLYTIWLLVACIAAWFLRERRGAQRALVAALALGSTYLGWSLVADRGPMRFARYPSDVEALREVATWPAVERLRWFNHGFMKAEVRDGLLVLSDLRMGAEPDYTFRFAVARREGGRWVAIPPQQIEWPWEARRRLGELWRRIWSEPEAGRTGQAP